MSEQSLNSPRPDLGPIRARPAEIPGYFTGLDRRGGRGGREAAWVTRHQLVLSPVSACCDGRRAQSWFVKAVSCLPTSPHLASQHHRTQPWGGNTSHQTQLPSTNHRDQGGQQYNSNSHISCSSHLNITLQSLSSTGNLIFSQVLFRGNFAPPWKSQSGFLGTQTWPPAIQPS